jgi:hypothetical protein
MPMPYQFKPIFNDAWDGAAMLVKPAPGNLLRLSVRNPNDEEIFILVYDHSATSGLPTDPIECVSCPPGYNVVFRGGVEDEYVTGIVLKAAEAMDGTGALDTNILVTGRYM